MSNFSSGTNAANSFHQLLKFRYFYYLVFLILMMYKLVHVHETLNIRNVDMNRLDDLIALGSIILVSFWTFWLPRRGQIISLIILDILLTALIYSDLIYYRYFQDFITVPVLLQAGQVGALGDSIQSLLRWQDIWFFVDWLLLIGWIPVMMIYRRCSNHGRIIRHNSIPERRKSKVWIRCMTGLITFIIGFSLTFFPIKHYKDTWAGDLFKGNWWNMSLYNITGLLGFHAYDIYRYTKEHIGSQQLSAEEINHLQDWFTLKQEDHSEQDELFGKYKGSNVIVIQTEALMNFMIGQRIGGQEVTPNFNVLMKDSLYYSNYYHQTGQGRTSDADFSSQTSLHPLPTGSVFVRYPDHQFDSLPSILKKNGYTSNAFHAYEPSFWNRTLMYQALGYDRFYSKNDFTLDEPLGWSLGDKSFFQQSLNKMKDLQEPFYSFLITLTSHHPYVIPKNIQELDTGEFKGTIFGDYLQSVHYVDAAFGELVAQMKQEGLWDRTILYIYGDHDNSLSDKAAYEKFLGKSLSELDMAKIMNQVPLLIHLPDRSQASVNMTEPAGQLDMAPSIMHLLGISTQSYHMMGNDLFDGSKRFVALRSGAFTDGKLYFIPSPNGNFDDGSCYDLQTNQ
ncbi:LTA synthase family protein [Paenibacillus pini]|uniref:Lipoteichoic acid synthase LtaS Type IVa n=1 Tax=Paenibacillus pini JCM 16418 TaxID=1236976 RepID=W7YFZ4_9BACL|nr:LTA synthase family protein [Paenibacillus pini]GAF06458.1 lipoteichoic acid synthase LtaS Type IVa [Paenibacillus pini JCM 16418]